MLCKQVEILITEITFWFAQTIAFGHDIKGEKTEYFQPIIVFEQKKFLPNN